VLGKAIFACVIGAVAAGASPATAQSFGWSVGVGIGGPDYYEPAPFYDEPVYVPVEPRKSPDEVFDALEAAGYSDFTPMAPRGDYYKLSAVNPRGDFVALEISVWSGQIEREYILAEGRRRPVTAVAPRMQPRDEQFHADEDDYDEDEDDGDDPLVVY
jgi:hypothetical protein